MAGRLHQSAQATRSHGEQALRDLDLVGSTDQGADVAPVPVLHETTYISLRTICRRLDVTHTTVYNWIKAGAFPKPIKFGTRSRWNEGTFRLWCEEREKAL